jgi:hypothetical protein
MSRVTILLFDDRFDGCTSNHVGRRQIGFTQSEIDAAGLCAIENPPDHAPLDPL